MATYYVSNSGNDSNNGLTPETAFETLEHLVSLVSRGDEVLLHRGSVFDPLLLVSIAASGETTIDFSDYGEGTRPIVSAFVDPGTNWVDEGGNIWSYENSGFEDVKVLLIGSTPKPYGVLDNIFNFNIDSRTANTITSSEIDSIPNIEGGEIVYKARKWMTNAYPVTNQTSNTLTFDYGGSMLSYVDGKFHIQNHPECLQQNDDWCYVDSEKKVYLYSDVDPNTLNIKISFHELALRVQSTPFLNFENIIFEGGYSHAANVRSNSVHMNRCVLRYAGADGVRTFQANDFHFTRGHVYWCNNHGINIVEQSTNALIDHNKINDCATFIGMAVSGSNQQNGVNLGFDAHDCVVRKNNIQRIGNCGIYYRGDNCLIEENYVSECSVSVADSGAYYTFAFTNTSPFNRGYDNVICRNNIAINCHANVDGLPSGQQTPDCAGLYTDDNTVNTLNHRNFIEGCDRGLFVHNSQDCDYTDNIFYDNAIEQLRFSDDDAQGANTYRIRNIEITGNTFVSKSGQLTSHARDSGSYASGGANTDPFDYGLVDNNLYDWENETSFRRQITGSIDATSNFETWKSETGLDANSEKIEFDRSEILVLLNDSEEEDTFSLGGKIYKDWEGNEYDSNSITLHQNESIVLFEEGEIPPPPPSPNLKVNIMVRII